MRKLQLPHIQGPWLLLLLFGVLYGLITFVNHYLFRTNALDLGVYAHAAWDYAHGTVDDSTSFRTYSEPILADHFDLHLLFFSPLVKWFGAWGLLFVQWLAILWGALGVYRLAQFKKSNYAIWAMAHLLAFFAIFQALGYDYHSNVTAAMALPWWFLALEKRKYFQSWFLLVFILFAKENMAPWMIFCTSGTWLLMRRTSIGLHINMLFQLVFCAAYFYFIVFQVMPFMATDGSASNLQYSMLKEWSYAPSWEQSKLLFKSLFTNHLSDSYGDYFKLEFYLLLLLSGGLLLFRKPAFIWMMLPVLAWKMWHDHPSMWGINGQYAIEFAPLIAIGVIYCIPYFKHPRQMYVVLLILTSICTIRSLDNPVVPVDRAALRFYQPAHYSRDFDVKKAHELLKLIPKNASVCAQSSVFPHLADRDNIHLFPNLFQSQYVVLSHEERTFPLSQEAYLKEVDALLNSSNWLKVGKSDYLIILKRKNPAKP
jgi:uncharacterized membrane protein